MIQRKLGCTMEEAIRRLAAPPPPAAGTPPAPGAAAAPPAADPAAALALAEAEAEIKKLKKSRKRRRLQHEAEITDAELKNEAIRAGIPPQYVGWSRSEYDRLFADYLVDPTKVPPEVKKAFDGDGTNIDGVAVFGYIRKTHMPTAAVPAPVDLTLSTGAPASHEPGGDQPPAAPVGTPPTIFDAGKMSEAEWRKHKRSMGITG